MQISKHVLDLSDCGLNNYHEHYTNVGVMIGNYLIRSDMKSTFYITYLYVDERLTIQH